MLSSLKKMRGDKKGWYKVSDLVAGLEIARPRADFDATSGTLSDDIVWDEIVSIKPVGRERVYDIEVEGTHNFVGNGIFAHNTYVLRANTMLAVEGQVNASTFIAPAPIASSTLMAEIPYDVLTADGKGVDIYKLATYSLAGVQALASRVDAAEVRLTSLEDRLAALESGAMSSASGLSFFASSTEQLAGWLASAGNGIADLYAKIIHTQEVHTEKLCVTDGSGETCVTKAQLDALIASVPGAIAPPSPVAPPADTTGTSTPPTPATPPADTGSTPSTGSGQASSPADGTPPVVTLVGAAAIQINVGDAFTDPGATALDETDNDLTANIVVTGAVNTALAGLYELTYTATDAAGNSASVSRVVTVVAPSAQTEADSTTTTTTTTTTP